jgi:hypothetical protein
MNRLRQFLYLDHRPIQIFLATLWVFYGCLLLFKQVPFIENPIVHFDKMPARLEGAILLTIGILGYYGAIARNLKADFMFAVFTLYKNCVSFLTIIMVVGFENSSWVNDLVQTLGAVLLLNKNIINFSYEKKLKEAIVKELELQRELGKD